MNDSMKIIGKINIKLLEDNGSLIKEWTVYNSIMNVGFAELANLAGNVSSPAYFTRLALGTSNTAVAANQTALVAEIVDTGLARTVATVSRVTTTQTNDTLQLYYEFTATGTKAVEEVGIFNAASVGTMLARALTGTISMVNTNKLQITYQVKFS
jgi:hypothetical protein